MRPTIQVIRNKHSQCEKPSDLLVQQPTLVSKKKAREQTSGTRVRSLTQTDKELSGYLIEWRGAISTYDVSRDGAPSLQSLHLTCYAERSTSADVIRSWGNSATRRLFESGRSRFRGLDTESALELLAILNAAERLDHIGPL